jgi:mycothiol synthase
VLAYRIGMRMRPVERPNDLAGLEELFQICHDADGHWPLGEHKYLSLIRSDSSSLIGIVVEADDASGTLIGYGHLSPNRDDSGWGLELAFHPLWRTGSFMEELVHAAVEAVRHEGGTSVRLWVFRPSVTGALTDLGFNPERELRQLRCHLPLEHQTASLERFTVRPFVQAVDEDAWIEVNNLAFEGHPENGSWNRQVLGNRLQQPWYDEKGFLMAWDGDDLAGFCWTKLHDGGIGEIYTIATHPQWQGLGLGKALVVEGLWYLAVEYGCKIGMLYVDAANQRALRLYEGLGFWVDHIDRSFIRHLAV